MLWVSIRDIGWFRGTCTEQLVPKMEKGGGVGWGGGGEILALFSYVLKCEIWTCVGEPLEKLLAS